MTLSNAQVIRHKYRNQLLATPPSKEIRVLMIGNNPRELGCLSMHLRNFAWKRFLVNATFDLSEGWKIARYYNPDYILIDGSLSADLIRNFVDQLRNFKATSKTVVALLKESNHSELVITGVQDYLLSDNIASDTFAFDVLNAIAHQKQEESKQVFEAAVSRTSGSWFSQLFGKKVMVNG